MSRVKYFSQCPKCEQLGKDTRHDNLANYLDGSVYCFACHYFRFPLGFRPRAVEEVNVPKALLPSDFTREVPSRAWEWLLQYGLSIQYWQASCGYSEKDSRLVFLVGGTRTDPKTGYRVQTSEETYFSIGRYIESGDGGSASFRPSGGDHFVDRASPKKPKKWYVYGDPHKHCEVISPANKEARIVCLVEDIVSAHKVGQIHDAIPLFGTQIHPPHLYFLSRYEGEIVLWLDKDQEFNTKKQAFRLESLINKSVKVIHTDKDPKSLSLKEIKDGI